MKKGVPWTGLGISGEGQKVPSFIDGISSSFGFLCGSMASYGSYGNNQELNTHNYSKAIWFKRDAGNLLAANAHLQSIFVLIDQQVSNHCMHLQANEHDL